MAEPESRESAVPIEFPGVPPDRPVTEGHVRNLLSSVDGSLKSLDASLKSVRDDLRAAEGYIRSEGSEHKSDFRWIIGTFAAGFIILAGMFITGYLLVTAKIDQVSSSLASKIDPLTTSQVRTETKLDDLIQRIPPVQQAPAKR